MSPYVLGLLTGALGGAVLGTFAVYGLFLTRQLRLRVTMKCPECGAMMAGTLEHPTYTHNHPEGEVPAGICLACLHVPDGSVAYIEDHA